MARPLALVTMMCVAEVLTMLGFSSFAALLPLFRDLWQLSNTEAGWISGIFFGGYTAAVPILVSLTDRVDPRRIWLLCAGLAAFACLGFALFAEGFWTAMLFQALAGMALAGTYMPGLKALNDLLQSAGQSRAIAFYTSSFGVGAALSYPLAASLAAYAGWAAAFALPGIAALMAFLLVLVLLPSRAPEQLTRPETALLDFRPVIRNRSALAYSLCYAVHSWELFGLRSWVVAFLTFTAAQHDGVTTLAPTTVAFAMTLLGVPSSILGNEASIRFGRRRWVAGVMTASAAVCFVVGFTSGLPYALVAALFLLHGMTVAGESASVTAGAIGNAAPAYRGATMALHSTLGFAGAFVGPLAFGIVLDAAGGISAIAWGIAFAHMGIVVLLGPVFLALLRPTGLPGDGGTVVAKTRPARSGSALPCV